MVARVGYANRSGVKKAPKQIPGREAEKSALIECSTINDFMLGGAQSAREHRSHWSKGLFLQARSPLTEI